MQVRLRFWISHSTEIASGIVHADDSPLCSRHEYPVCALANISQYFNLVKEFYEKWGIKINSAKCEANCIRNASINCKGSVVFESKSIKLI